MSDKPGFFEGTPDPAGVLASVGLKPGMEVIDLCSGDGWFTLQIAKIARHVAAIDIDPTLLDVARVRLMEAGVTNCSFIAGDAYDITRLWPETVDLVFMANAFHGVPDPARLATAVKAGRFAIVNWHARPRERTTILGEPRGPKTELRLTPEKTIGAVKMDGLQCLTLVEIPPYHSTAQFSSGRPLKSDGRRMSAYGTKRTCRSRSLNVRFWGECVAKLSLRRSLTHDSVA